jgi:DNA-binding YbaB/EbfC family protein
MPDLQQLMQQAAEMQAEVQRRQAALAEQVFEGSAGGGAVTVRMLGSGRLEQVEMDPAVLDPDDAEMVGDLVVAAVNDAHRAMAEAAGEAMGGLGGLGDGLPDVGDLGDLGGLGDLLR